MGCWARDYYLTERKRLHNEELNCLYRSPTIIRVIEYRRLRWAEYVPRVGEGRGVLKILSVKLQGKDP